VQEYFPETGEEFSTRSPHNIFVTYYGRMGGVGVALWGGFCVVLLGRTWRCLRHTSDPVTWSLWCGAWVILVSGCFGVVLEGPMGAVIFWTLLGLANSTPVPDETTAPAEVPAEARAPEAVGA
jgi:O-antigen ligase